jgi:DNA-binding NarL/FixJ family response regulator/anti-sigma regulatory factor (Ser/Thr protein kinase)
MDESVRVMVVDDSASTRTMLREALALEGGIHVVGEAGTGHEAIARVEDLAPDVILMDVRMPDLDGVKAAQAIMAKRPSTRIVALTWSDDPATVRDMLTAGAIGYVVKGGSIEELYSAIRHASSGEPELDQKVLPAAMEDLRRLLDEERGRREQIERLARSRAEFVQILSHELRTPLTVISGALQMLRRTAVDSDEGQLVESAIRRVAELEFLVEGLELVASGPSLDGGAAHPRPAIITASERIGIHPDTAGVLDEAWTGVSHRYLSRVAFELLSNAARHGAPPIEVRTSRRDDRAGLTVCDGGGWAPAATDFSAFFQEDMSSTRDRSGFGLGLFLAARLCQACQGDLSIRVEGGVTVAEATFRLH